MELHHVAFRTPDVTRLVAFYRDVLGLTAVRERPGVSVWLAAGAAVIMCERMSPEEPRIDGGSLELVAFRVDEARRAEVEAALAAASVPIEARTAHTSYFRDPDGRRVGVSTHPLGPA